MRAVKSFSVPSIDEAGLAGCAAVLGNGPLRTADAIARWRTR
ncbi:hypothetical protein EKH55_3110 [Sinorhizobium alkalisoli]|nr:hypothetical protein EKH55_3110 [Sinorhizobium alkalisoli]